MLDDFEVFDKICFRNSNILHFIINTVEIIKDVTPDGAKLVLTIRVQVEVYITIPLTVYFVYKWFRDVRIKP